MSKKKIIQGIPFLILLITVVYTGITGVVKGGVFSWQIYAGIISTIICLVLYFTKYRWFKYVFTFVLIVGSFNILHFTFNELTINFSLGLFKFINVQTIDIQILSFSILLLFTIINRKRIRVLIKNLLSVSDEQKQNDEEAVIKSFEKKYSTMSQSELKNIVENEKSYTVEAVKAARKLLDA
jgi:predicted ferric reductase